MRDCVRLQLKTQRVIESCITLEQLKVAEAFAYQAVHCTKSDWEIGEFGLSDDKMDADRELGLLIRAKRQTLKQSQNQPPAGQ